MVVPLLGFVVASLLIFFGREAALRAVFVAIVVLAPLRGGLLAIADSLGISDPGLAVNALVPALVAAFALGVLVVCRPKLALFPRALSLVWGLVVVVALLNLPFQLVGLELYVIGLAQYIVYPTLAVSAWFLWRPNDLERVTYLFFFVGTAVAITVIVQAAGIESFIQAASAQVDGFAANRYAGVTGSYLHTSAFLGVCAVLGLGLFLRAGTSRQCVVIGALVALILSGVVLTFSRSGIMISIIGLAVLLLFAASGKRLSAASMLFAAVAIAALIGTWGGVAPDEALDRTTSGLTPGRDAGNQQRLEGIGAGITQWREGSAGASPAEQQGDSGNPWVNRILGDGLAYTGNARQLTDGEVLAVESYLVKLLVETGIVGLIVVGGILVWALSIFLRSFLHPRSPVVAAIGAAGFGLSLYNLIYPALETQLLALTWWVLLSLALYASSSRQTPSDSAGQWNPHT